MTEPKRNESLRRKSSARMAAVQCLYKGELMGELTNPLKLIRDYQKHSEESAAHDDGEWLPEDAPNQSLFSRIIEGVCINRPALDETIRANLRDGWTFERMTPLIIAILRAGVFEITYRENLSAKVLIDEYVTLAGDFFDEAEQDFVNALLNRAAQAGE